MIPAIPSAAQAARQNIIEARPDVRVYTTAPLEQATEVTGPVQVVLYVVTTTHNADFTAKLVDVHPDRSAYNVCDGILRQDYSPGVSRIGIRLSPTSMVFLKGHRIRRQTIYHGRGAQSYIQLPIVPAE